MSFSLIEFISVGVRDIKKEVKGRDFTVFPVEATIGQLSR